MLASLWLLESVESVWRSPATVCLNDYLKHLAVFSPEVRGCAWWFVVVHRSVIEASGRSGGVLRPCCARCRSALDSIQQRRSARSAPIPPSALPHPNRPRPASTPLLPSLQAVVAITADWKASFQQLRAGVVGAQMDLLKRLDWRTRLDAAAEVQPCRALLFRTASPCAAARPSLRDRWAAHMHLLVQQVQQKV